MEVFNRKRCLICKPHNDTIYHHVDTTTQNIWLYCNKCDRAYSLRQYCHLAGVSMATYLKGDIDFLEAKPNEVNKIEWPNNFISLNDHRAKRGVDYILSRGLDTAGDMYYDMDYEGIVFPYYFDNIFCGAQIRFIEPRQTEDGPWKITTIPGTRLGLLVYGFNQKNISPAVKTFVVTEGAFNSIAIQQSLDHIYGGLHKNPFRCVACSGSGASKHHLDLFGGLKDRGYGIICAPDNDEAGEKMLTKFISNSALTHVAITDTSADWNDERKKLGKIDFARYFLSKIKDIKLFIS